MKEQRQFERFPLSLPAQMEMINSSKKQLFKLKIRNISSTGAFIDTTEKFSQGTRFKMKITVPSKRIKELTGSMSIIECEGSIVRCTEHGMAVCFNGKCQILNLKSF